MLIRNRYYKLNIGGFMVFEVLLALGIAAISFYPILRLVAELGQHMVTLDGQFENQVPNTATIFSKDTMVDMTAGKLNSYVSHMIRFGEKDCTNFLSSLQKVQKMQNIYGGNLSTVLKWNAYSGINLGVGTTSTITNIKVFNNQIYMGLNSASSSDPDLIAFKQTDLVYLDLGNNQLDLFKTKIRKVNTGPGIVEFSVLNDLILAVNTSSKSVLQEILDTGNSLVLQKEFSIPVLSAGFVAIAKSLEIYEKYAIVGLEKNIGPEIYAYDLVTGAIVASIETGYGITRMKIKNRNLFVIGPSNPEIDVFKINSGTDSVTTTTATTTTTSDSTLTFSKLPSYDAPGSSGNGRSADLYGNLLTFGRSRGNEEFDILEQNKDSSIDSVARYKLSASIDSIVAGTSSAILLTSDSAKELQLLTYSYQSNPISLLGNSILVSGYGYLDLPARSNDFACVDNTLLVGTIDPAYAFLVITI